MSEWAISTAAGILGDSLHRGRPLEQSVRAYLADTPLRRHELDLLAEAMSWEPESFSDECVQLVSSTSARFDRFPPDEE